MIEAKKKGNHNKEEWLKLIKEFPYCVRCKARYIRLVKDHIIPIYQGGDNSINNIQPLCSRCNSQKGSEIFNWKEYRRKNGFKKNTKKF